jgi:3-oxoacyl-[acyl-carrier-protein] synthase-3
MRGWREFPTLRAAVEANAFSIQQDVRLLNDAVVGVTVGRGLMEVMARRKIRPEEYDWFLPHYSSAYFREKVGDEMRRIGFEIPYAKWFTNLAAVGNIGAASIYVMIDELFHSGSLKKGQRILCFVPESGRFSVGYMSLTVT